MPSHVMPLMIPPFLQVEQELKVKAISRNPPKKPCNLDILSGTVKVTKHETQNPEHEPKSKKLGTHVKSSNNIRTSDKAIRRGHGERTVVGDSRGSMEDKSCRAHVTQYPTSSGVDLQREPDVCPQYFLNLHSSFRMLLIHFLNASVLCRQSCKTDKGLQHQAFTALIR